MVIERVDSLVGEGMGHRLSTEAGGKPMYEMKNWASGATLFLMTKPLPANGAVSKKIAVGKTRHQCAWCGRLIHPNGTRHGPRMVSLRARSHGICNECFRRVVEQQIAAAYAQR